LNKKRLFLILVIAILAGIQVLVRLGVFDVLEYWEDCDKHPKFVDTSFATEVTMKDHWNKRKLDVTVTDPNDIKALKEIFSKCAYTTTIPACMLTEEVSITLTNGKKSIIFCPSFCKDNFVAIGYSNKFLFIPAKQNKEMHRICNKYGLFIPPRLL